MVEIDEERFSRAFHVPDARSCGDVDKRSVTAIAEKMPAPFTANHEQIEPAIVVIVRERRVGRALRQNDVRALGSIAHEAALHPIQMRAGFYASAWAGDRA